MVVGKTEEVGEMLSLFSESGTQPTLVSWGSLVPPRSGGHCSEDPGPLVWKQHFKWILLSKHGVVSHEVFQ